MITRKKRTFICLMFLQIDTQDNALAAGHKVTQTGNEPRIPHMMVSITLHPFWSATVLTARPSLGQMSELYILWARIHHHTSDLREVWAIGSVPGTDCYDNFCVFFSSATAIVIGVYPVPSCLASTFFKSNRLPQFSSDLFEFCFATIGLQA